MLIRLLAVLPFLAILFGSIFFNRSAPLILGLPPMLAWLLLWIVLTSGIMGLIYMLDPDNRASRADAATPGAHRSGARR